MTADLLDTRLDNGLRVVVSADPLAPAAAVNLWYDVGSRHESTDRTGLAHLFEHLMFQGSRQVASGEHFSLLQAVGGRLNATTSFDRTNYFETVPAHALELALWLEADRMGGLLDALGDDGLANQRDVVKNERRQRYDNQPYGTAWEQLFALGYPEGHPYHHMPIGSMAHLDAVTLADCQEFFRNHYAPDNAVLTVAGAVEPSQVLALVQRQFGGIPAYTGTRAEPRDGAISALEADIGRDVHEDVPAESIYQLYRVEADGTVGCEAADLATRILAEGGSSRLVSRLVRKDELATGVSMSVMRLVGGTSAVFAVARARSGVDVDRLAAALDDELARFAAQGPTDAEMSRAAAQGEREFLDSVDSTEGVADELSRGATLFDDPRYAWKALDRLAAVTPEQVQAAAADRLQPGRRAVLTYRLGSPA